MASFQDNFRAIMNVLATGPEATYRTSNPNGNWNSGALKSVSRAPNMYTGQNKVDGGYTPKDPTTDPLFLENYRNTTKSLGAVARAQKTRGQKYPNVDTETQAIMDRIKLPSYADAMTEGKRMELAALAKNNVSEAIKKYQKESDEWDEDNFYYKLRAAQTLKREPESIREGILNNFNISAYDAKNELDKTIKRANAKEAQAWRTLGKVTKDLAEDLRLRMTGQRKTYTDENGVTRTTTITSGPADLDELARRLGDNDSFRLYDKSDYDENGELTAEAKARGPVTWNSKTTNPDGTPKTESGTDGGSGTGGENTATEDGTDEIIEYTYKPGDTFGQVIQNLGLGTDKGLWGPDGDVEYYTQQLEKQLWDSGVWPQGVRQNIPVGTTIKLRRRK